MQITLVRHGKPDLSLLALVPLSAFPGWMRRYDQAPLARVTAPRIPHLGTVINHYWVSSSLRRSQDSVRLLSSREPDDQRELFDEPGFPEFGFWTPPLPAELIARALRGLWILGYSRQCESRKAAGLRAEEGLGCLLDLAQTHGSVVHVGHGMMLRLIAAGLRDRGWVQQGGATFHTYWSWSRFESPS